MHSATVNYNKIFEMQDDISKMYFCKSKNFL